MRAGAVPGPQRHREGLDMEIEVAPLLLGKLGFDGPKETLANIGPAVEWGQRPKALISATPQAKLKKIIDKGAKSLGLKSSPGEYATGGLSPSELGSDYFFHDSSSSPPFVSLHAIVMKNGSAQWWYDPMGITLAQVQIAHDAGLLTGDPTKIYVVVDEPPEGVGNGIDYWFEVLRALPYLEPVLKTAAEGLLTYGVVAAFTKGVQKLRTRWDTTGGDVKKYLALFQVPRTTHQAAALLSVPEEEKRMCHQLLTSWDLNRQGMATGDRTISQVETS
jgi:hypothetical protein